MNIHIQLSYNDTTFTLEDPIDADRYSAIDLLNDSMKLLRRRCNFSFPRYPNFYYRHPKSKKLVEISCDRQLLKMFELFESETVIEVVVEDGTKPSELFKTYQNWLKDAEERERLNATVIEQVEIFPSSPPQTQPSQDIAVQVSNVPESVDVIERHPSAPNPIVQTASGMADGKRNKRKRKPRGLNLVNLPTIVQTDTPSVDQPRTAQNMDFTRSNSGIAQFSSSPNLQSSTPSINNDTIVSTTAPLQIVTTHHSAVMLQSEIGSELIETVGDDCPDQTPCFSEDSWDNQEKEDHYMSSADGDTDSVYEAADQDDVELDDLSKLKDDEVFSGDEEEVVVLEDKFLRGGKPFEQQPDGSIILEPGQWFLNKDIFRDVIEDYTVQEGIDLHRVANDPWKYTVLCNNLDTCKWRLHASRLADNVTFMIKTIKEEHSCVRLVENPAATSKWIVRKILPELRANKGMSPSNIQHYIHSKFGVVVNYMKCFRAKKEAMKLLDGNHADSYAMIHQYSKIMLERNPGSIVDLQFQEYLNGPPTFSRIFVCFSALKDGFLKGCRPFIGVDGCHLKGQYGGVLLTAVSIDANNGIFPVAFSIVASETTATWTYFFSNLRLITPEDVRSKWVIISDSQKGVEPALAAVLPECTRRICCRHLYANFKKENPGVMLRNLFWEATQCYTNSAFRDVLKKIEETSISSFRYLREVDYNLWVRLHMLVEAKVIETTSNFVESFNSKLSAIRGSPIFTLLENLKRMLMKKLNSRREALKKMNGSITPYAKKVLYNNTRAGSKCGYSASSEFEFEVTEPNRHYIMNLRDRHCDCMAWDLSGIPCKHVCAVLGWKRMDKERFVHPYFSMSRYVETYAGAISPIPDHSMWPEPVGLHKLAPPFLRKLPGRPKKNRRREEGEPAARPSRSNHVKCGHCDQMGHNSRTCASKTNRGDGQGAGLVPVGDLTTIRGKGRGKSNGKSQPGRGRKKKTIARSMVSSNSDNTRQ